MAQIMTACPTCGTDVTGTVAGANGVARCPGCGEQVRTAPAARHPEPAVKPSSDEDDLWLKRKPTDGWIAGSILVALGILVMLYAATRHVGYSVGGIELPSLETMNSRTNGMIFGGVLFLGGIIELALCNVRIALWRHARLLRRNRD